MKPNYIIIQAGGKGTRLEHLTRNKPKALIPINNLPMIFYLFNKYPNKKFIIIGDYKRDVLKKYLRCFAKVKYNIVTADTTGTCAGINEALELLPDNESFMLVWSDLILSDSFEMPNIESKNYIGISTDFCCRWSYKNDEFIEEKSYENGVAGLFIFKDKKEIDDVPSSGEFVRYLRDKKSIFKRINLIGTREFGTLEEYNKLSTVKCRPFNSINIMDNKLIKEPLDEQGKKLAINEVEWYKYVMDRNFGNIPTIYNYDPLTMELIDGKNIYEYDDLPTDKKEEILTKIIDLLSRLHDLGETQTDYFSVYETYINKTFDRLDKVRDLIPFANQKTIVVNDRTCRNVFFFKDELEEKLRQIKCEKFNVIHGDCTFSNMMLNNDDKPLLIDPRGYFGETKIFGDVKYDWAKLYYSIVGNYDKFNLKQFDLLIDNNEVKLKIESSNWENCEKKFFDLINVDEYEIKLLHAVIWLSLTTYAWQDYDSICAAFYNGIYYLEEVL